VAHLISGDWKTAYYPAHEEFQNGICEEVERLLVHGEYTLYNEF